jgi:leader peptidase (prepilin peptidase)/N-methyltransferase
MIRILGTTFAGLLGLAFGSFLNVCLTRWPEDESIVHPRSHCRSCDHTLEWWENIPLFSWLFLRGRCSNCRTWIGWRYPLVELSIGVLWATAVWGSIDRIFAPDVSTVAIYCEIARMLGQLVFYWFMVALAVLDAENLWLPNFLTLPGIALGLAAFFLPEAIEKYWGDSYPQSPGLLQNTIGRLLAILVAAGIILLTRWLYKFIRHREGVGLGDAKLMALLAAWLGLPLTLLTFVISTFLGAIASLILLAIPSARTNEESWATTKLPFGTFLCVGGIISSLWGQPVVAAYLRLVGY